GSAPVGGGVTLAALPVAPSNGWTQTEAELAAEGTFALYFRYSGGGMLDLKQFALEPLETVVS
ncbi:MAG: hypothetical protein LUD83_09655, partial [Clostridiales bacterium]|nr:hypothetical protein [Clostridiales bacterium]